MISIDKKIEDLQKQIEKLKEEKSSLEAMPDEQRLAEALHKKLCHLNHTDCCGWDYESWNNIGFSRNIYLQKAKTVLTITDIETALKICEAL